MRSTILALAFCGAAVLGAQAHDGTGSVRLPDQIVFQPPPTGRGPETVVLYGDPTQPGVFVMRMRFAAGYRLMPLWRPDPWRTAVVLSGTLHFGLGEVWDESRLVAYPPGTFFSLAPRAPHFAWARDGEVVVQFTGMGPTAVNRIAPP